ncbi:MAG TPA: hypothetical protein VFZ16_01730 [Hyphomicrobiaceae bacterium]|nr:hypothetical protein [Hyphomicrobiaceae bacterium]
MPRQIYVSASREPMELKVAVAVNWAVNKEHVIQSHSRSVTTPSRPSDGP